MQSPYSAPTQRPVLTFFLAGLCLLMYAWISLVGKSAIFPDPEVLMSWGGNMSNLSLGGSPWRLFTSTFLHNGLLHLVPSLAALLISSFFLEKRAGLLLSSGVFVLTALSGATWSAIMQDNLLSVGANGAALGMTGALLSLYLLGVLPKRNLWPAAIASAVMLIFDLVNPFGIGSDLWLDLGGFLSGLMAGVVLGWGAKPTAGKRTQSDAQQVEQEELEPAMEEVEGVVALAEEVVDTTEELPKETLEETREEEIQDPEPFLPEPLPIEIPPMPNEDHES